MKKRAFLYIFLIIAVLAVVVVVLNLTFRRDRYDTAIPVRTYSVGRGSLEDLVTGNGSFKPGQSANVAAQVTGEVSSVWVKGGDEVRKGSLLIRLKEDEYLASYEKLQSSLEVTRRNIRQTLVTLRAQYRSAAANLTEAERTFNKNKELLSSKTISEDVYLKTESAYNSALVNEQSAREQLNLRCDLPLDAEPLLTSEKDEEIVENAPEVKQASLNLKSSEDSLAKCRITAPISGTVTMVQPIQGDFVAAGTPVVKIESLLDVIAEIQIDEVDIGKISVGQEAVITSDSIIGEELSGTVTAVAPTITSLGNTRISLVEIEIGPTTAQLKSGASCTVKITVDIKQNILTIPLSAFITEENSTFAYRLAALPEENSTENQVYRLEKTEIQTGSSNVSSIEILSGLSEDDLIVVGNLKLLRDGVYVTSKDEE